MHLAAALVVGFGGGILVMGLLQARGPASSAGFEPLPPVTASSAPIDVSTEGRPYKGPADAPVTVVEFTDYECPYCAQHFRETYSELLSRYDRELRYVIRNFPVSTLHPHAQLAAVAAECAHDQGRFWDYHDLLFERSPALERADLLTYAREARLDLDAFEGCIESEEMAAIVERDFQDGVAYGVRATPTFFINGRRVVGALALDQFVPLIDAALEEL